MTLIHRDARPEDAPALTELGRRSFTETFGHLYSPDNLEAFLATHNEGVWRDELNDAGFAVRIVEAEGALIAYAKLGPPKLPFEPERPSLELRQFYVLKPWQGAGIADRLMRWVIGEASKRGAGDLYLSVFVDNHRARRFYERYGFRFVTRHAFMVGDHADEDHILKLALES